MKTKRLNRNKRNDVKSIKRVVVDYNHVDTLIGRTVVLKSIPTDIKRAKKLFKVDKKYKIVKSVKEHHINTLMAVHLKAKDGEIYCVQFPHWVLTAN